MSRKIKMLLKKGRIHIYLLEISLLVIFLVLGLRIMQIQSARANEQVLKEEFNHIRELVTIRQFYHSAIYYSVKEHVIQERSMLFSVDFELCAGLDLGDGYEISTSLNQVNLILPRAKLLSLDAKDSSIEQILLKERFSSIVTSDYLPLLEEEKEQIRLNALDDGLLEKAEDQAYRIFYYILKNAGYQDVNIRYKPDSFLGGEL